MFRRRKFSGSFAPPAPPCDRCSEDAVVVQEFGHRSPSGAAFWVSRTLTRCEEHKISSEVAEQMIVMMAANVVFRERDPWA